MILYVSLASIAKTPLVFATTEGAQRAGRVLVTLLKVIAVVLTVILRPGELTVATTATFWDASQREFVDG